MDRGWAADRSAILGGGIGARVLLFPEIARSFDFRQQRPIAQTPAARLLRLLPRQPLAKPHANPSAPPSMTDSNHRKDPPCIGVFDSGLGGLSVLRALRLELPQAALLYVADSGHAPYGERGADFVQRRSLALAEFLRGRGAQVLVVACNTATAAAIQALRDHFGDVPIVGVEPGIKPAAAATRKGRVGVLATEGTLRSERFQLLAQAHAAHIELHLQPCPGLAAAIEGGNLDAPELLAIVRHCCTPLRDAGVDTVVLGCTHYPFISKHIQACLGPQVTLIDTAHAVARRTAEVAAHRVRPLSVDPLEHECANGDARPAPVPRLWTTGDPRLLAQVTRQWLDFPCAVELQPLDSVNR